MAALGTRIQVVGIDPGRGGALVHIGSDGFPTRVWKTPLILGRIDFLAIEGILRSLNSLGIFEAAIEKQQPFGNTKGASQVVQNYGVYLHLLRDRVEMQFTEYHISTWKSKYGLLKRKTEEDAAEGKGTGEKFTIRNKTNKEKSLALANIHFPGAARRFGEFWTADAAEAALIGQLLRGEIIEREMKPPNLGESDG